VSQVAEKLLRAPSAVSPLTAETRRTALYCLVSSLADSLHMGLLATFFNNLQR
jgi:hypothetical protein